MVLDENKDFEKSEYYLSIGLNYINDTTFKINLFVSETYIKKLNRAYITEGYAYHYYIKNDLKTSLEKYQEVLSLAEDLKRVSLRIDILKKLGHLYKEMQNPEMSTEYLSKYISLNDSVRVIMNNSLSIPIESFPKESNVETPIKDSDNSTYIISIIALVTLVLFFSIYSYRNKKKKLQVIKSLISDDPNSNKNLNPNSNRNSNVDLNLPQKTEEELMLKLEEFEASKLFLDKNMSFSSLVSYLNTNEKYLRQVLKCNKFTDYNTYINELRIKYIVNKLEADPV